MDRLGAVIFGATGTAAGPFVNYRALLDTASIILLGLAGIIAVVGLVEGAYSLLAGDDEADESATNSRSRTVPSSQKDRPRNPSRQ